MGDGSDAKIAVIASVASARQHRRWGEPAPQVHHLLLLRVVGRGMEGCKIRDLITERRRPMTAYPTTVKKRSMEEGRKETVWHCRRIPPVSGKGLCGESEPHALHRILPNAGSQSDVRV